MIDIDEFIASLKRKIEFERKEYPDACNDKSWDDEHGILLSVMEVEFIVEFMCNNK